jgi:hypothetical protein
MPLPSSSLAMSLVMRSHWLNTTTFSSPLSTMLAMMLITSSTLVS